MNIIDKYLSLLVVIICIVTIISGIMQIAAPHLVLTTMSAETSPTSSYFFAIVGMFMALFGGLMLHAIYSARTSPEAILWCAFQKLGAFVAVTMAVMNGIFSPLALGVSFFDLFSGLLFLYYLKQRREQWPS
jgi:hypothetical protein